jgi:hypothetical protein
MRKGFLFLLFIIPALAFQLGKAPTIRWVIVNGGSLKVDGSTNVNQFSCAITNYSKPDTISVARNKTQPVQLFGAIELDVQKFDCHNPVMTSDLRKTLKSKEFPHLVIRFISMNRYPEGTDETKGIVTIELAGVTKQFEVDYKTVSTSSSFINLEGTRTVHFSDFNLVPPRKLGGMIRTNNELKVVFNLRIKVLDK